MLPDQPENHENEGRITHDVGDEAEAAQQRYELERSASVVGEIEDVVIEGEITLRFEIKGASTHFSITLADGEAIIGRRDPSADTAPEIDLSSYGAYQMGVSRRHASLAIHDKKLLLTDLGSRNGTYLNGHRVPANQTAIVPNGSEIRVGKIVANLYIQSH